MTVGFFARLNPTVLKKLSKVGLRFDLPQMDPLEKTRGWRLPWF